MLNRVISIIIKAAIFFAAATFLVSCSFDKVGPAYETNYPSNIEAIITGKCATAGCHNEISKHGAGGLDLSTWDKLFEGSRGGAVIIPYCTEFSTFCYYTNTDTVQGLVLLPTMPYNRSPLSSAEYTILKNWIQSGAPDKSGFVKFSDNPSRMKFYVGNQGCDVVTVFDSKSMLAMRYVNVGNAPVIEAPHMIKVSYDNQYWFTCFLAGNTFQKYSTSDNTLLAEANIGPGLWNTFALSPDGTKAYVVDFAGGKVAIVTLSNMNITFLGGLNYPHGVAVNNSNDTLYVTEQLGDGLTKIAISDFSYDHINLIQAFPIASNNLQIHEIAFTPDGSKYFITCQSSNEVRAVLTANDSVIAAIPVPTFPQELAFAKNYPYLFVSCMEATNTDPQKKSFIAVINYQTNTFIKNIYAGYQSHGIAIDDENNRVYVSNRNVNTTGPAPHHSSVCGGRNGYITAIDLNTLQLVPNFKAEVSVDPYGVGITH